MIAGIALAFIIYVCIGIMVGVILECSEDGVEIHECVWWPITVLKFLYKTLCKALFTGW